MAAGSTGVRVALLEARPDVRSPASVCTLSLSLLRTVYTVHRDRWTTYTSVLYDGRSSGEVWTALYS